MEQYLAQFHSGSVAYTILLYATVIAIGITLGKVKVFGISIGVTFVLFAGTVCFFDRFTSRSLVLFVVQKRRYDDESACGELNIA